MLYDSIAKKLNIINEKDVFKSNLYSVNILVKDKNKKNNIFNPIYEPAE